MNEPTQDNPTPPEHLVKWAIKARRHHEREAAQLARSLAHRPGPYQQAQLAMIDAHNRAVAIFAATAAGRLHVRADPTTVEALEAEASASGRARDTLAPLMDYCRARLPAECELGLVVGIQTPAGLALITIMTDRERLAEPLHGWASKVLAEQAAADPEAPR